jgi:hypothetical protein
LLKTRRLLNNFFSGAQRICDFLLFTRFGLGARRFYFLLASSDWSSKLPNNFIQRWQQMCSVKLLNNFKMSCLAAEIFSG